MCKLDGDNFFLSDNNLFTFNDNLHFIAIINVEARLQRSAVFKKNQKPEAVFQIVT